jgi:cation diffusion facilitator CzcD-associated flavoprotein CzcO
MSYSAHSGVRSASVELDVVIVGAGFSGIYMLHRLRERGFSVKLLESAGGIGGTWYHNRYPGARCDIESLDYSYSFSEELQQEWHWSEKYASQPEILRYLNHVADRFELWPDIRLNSTVSAAAYDDATHRWTLSCEDVSYSANYFIAATGVLSAAQLPDIPGLDSFEGAWYHTGEWPHEEIDFSGLRVGVIGTGSSGTQLIPLLAEQAEQLVVFQRTANYTMPARNEPTDLTFEEAWKAEYAERRRFARASRFGHTQLANARRGSDVSATARTVEFARRWRLGGLHMMRAFNDLMTSEETNSAAIEFVNEKVDAIVHDPATAALLKPRDLYLGTKRLASGSDYYETFNRDDVTLVDVRADPIEQIVPTGLRTRQSEYALDAIVFATGYDAMTGSILKIDPLGSNGVKLSEKWVGGPLTYLGLAVSGFPNLFVISGAGSPAVTSNLVTVSEQHVEWIADCLVHLRENGLDLIEATLPAESAWVEEVNALPERTLYRYARNTWFYGANTPGKPIVFMPYIGGVGPYGRKIAEVAARGYEGFCLGESN